MRTLYFPLSLEAALLGQARYWRDDRKSWRRKKRRADGSSRVSQPRSAAKDRALRDRYAELLDRFAHHDQRARDQAEQLDGCGPSHPCGNAACPACLGAFQHGLVRIATRFLKRANAPDGDIFAVSLIPADEMVPRADLRGLDLLNFRRRIRERLKPLVPHCAWLMLGIDLSLNEDKQQRFKPQWCPHLYGFFQTKLGRKKLKMELKKLFPAELPRVRRPVQITRFKPSRYGTSYLFKPDFHRRITYPYSGGERSKKAPLRTGRRAELQQVLRWLDRIQITDRLLLIGLKTVRSKSGVKIVLLRAPKAKTELQRPSYGNLVELHDVKTTPLARKTKSPETSGKDAQKYAIFKSPRTVST